jgi:alginate O-acetyltransferase complex protein AlgI
MLFNSWIFLPFILIVLSVYWSLRSRRWQNRWLILVSYVFYGAWDYRFLLLLIGTTLIDYWVGIMLARTEQAAARKRILSVSIVANLGVLGFFKYFNFFASSMVALLKALGVNANVHLIEIVLPVGISFYTFQSMSYTIDVYRRVIPAVRRLEDFVLYVAFFPQLVAGPIERASEMMPQFESPRRFKLEQWGEGLWLVLYGLFKKVVIADNLAGIVNAAFAPAAAGADDRTGVQCLIGVYAFAYQIYCDFSGYTDVARGIAKLLGFELMLNFNLPYLARNPSDFWRRWHISLSTWLRDYLYIPLGGSRGGRGRTYRNLFLTMLLGGLWHGAAWTFVLWGAFHGVALIVHRWLFLEGRPAGTARRDVPPGNPFTSALTVIGMFHLTCLGWLLFRANSLRQVGHFLREIATNFHWNLPAVEALYQLALFVVPLWMIELYARNDDRPWSVRPSWDWGLGPAVVAGLFISLILLSAPVAQSFIYFQF